MSEVTTKCFSCLAGVPCPSLVAWIGLTVSVSACCGSLMAAMRIAVAMLKRLDMTSCMRYTDIACLSVLCGMVFLGSLFLVLSTLSSKPRAHCVFNTATKNTCARVLNIIVIVKSFILCIIWIAVVAILTIPLLFLLLLMYLYNVLNIDKINLKDYGLSKTDYIIQGLEFKEFYNKSQDELICFAIAFFGAIGVCLFLILFMLFTTANEVRLEEAPPPSELTNHEQPAEDDVHGSKNSVVDTKM